MIVLSQFPIASFLEHLQVKFVSKSWQVSVVELLNPESEEFLSDKCSGSGCSSLDEQRFLREFTREIKCYNFSKK